MGERFPNNSSFNATRSKAREEEPKKEEIAPRKVINGEAKKIKKSVGKKFADTFIQGDISDVAGHIVHDILIPSAIETIGDMGHNLVDGMIYGDDAPARTRSRRSRSRERTSIDRGTGRSTRDRERARMHNRRTLNFDDIFLDTREEAAMVLEELQGRIEDYDRVTVADLYDAVGWDHDYTESKYGWYDLESARIIRVRGADGYGYSLDLPKAEQLD